MDDTRVVHLQPHGVSFAITTLDGADFRKPDSGNLTVELVDDSYSGRNDARNNCDLGYDNTRVHRPVQCALRDEAFDYPRSLRIGSATQQAKPSGLTLGYGNIRVHRPA